MGSEKVVAPRWSYLVDWFVLRMNATRVTFAALRLAAGRPSIWLTGLLLLAAWPYLSTVARMGIPYDSVGYSDVLYELAFMSMALGVLRGMAVLTKLSGPLTHVGLRPELATRILVLGSLGFLHALIAIAPAVGMGQFQSATPSSDVCVRLALVLFTLAAAGGALLGFQVPPGSAPWLLGVALCIAGVLLPHPLPLRSLGLLAVALYSAGWLLDHPPGRTA